MVLVTGATGFLGAHLACDLLLQGLEIKALHRSSSSLSEFNLIASYRLGDKKQEYLGRITWITGDILDYDSLLDALEGVEKVYHAAAVVSFWPKMREQMFRINVEGTANVVNACLEKKTGKLCYVSSIAALGRSYNKREIDEETPWTESELNSNYAKSKYRAEMEVWRGMEEGLTAVIVNPGVILGEGDWNKGSCRLFRNAFNGFPFYTRGVNGYVDVLDVTRAMILLMESNIKSERFVLVGENISVKDLFATADMVKRKASRRMEVKPWMAAIGWRIFSAMSMVSGREPMISKEIATTTTHQYYYSSRKIKELLFFRFTPIREVCQRISQYINITH